MHNPTARELLLPSWLPHGPDLPADVCKLRGLPPVSPSPAGLRLDLRDLFYYERYVVDRATLERLERPRCDTLILSETLRALVGEGLVRVADFGAAVRDTGVRATLREQVQRDIAGMDRVPPFVARAARLWEREASTYRALYGRDWGIDDRIPHGFKLELMRQGPLRVRSAERLIARVSRQARRGDPMDATAAGVVQPYLAYTRTNEVIAAREGCDLADWPDMEAVYEHHRQDGASAADARPRLVHRALLDAVVPSFTPASWGELKPFLRCRRASLSRYRDGVDRMAACPGAWDARRAREAFDEACAARLGWSESPLRRTLSLLVSTGLDLFGLPGPIGWAVGQQAERPLDRPVRAHEWSVFLQRLRYRIAQSGAWWRRLIPRGPRAASAG